MKSVLALSALLMDHISASNTNSMCLAGCSHFPYVSFAGIFSELFSAQSLETAINWQHRPEAEVLKLIHCFLLGNCSHREQLRKVKNLKITLSEWEKRIWGTDSHVRTTYTSGGTAFGAEIVLGRFIPKPILCLNVQVSS